MPRPCGGLALLGLYCLATTTATAIASATNGDDNATCTMHILNETSCTQQAFKWTNETSPTNCCATCTATAKCEAWEWWTPAVEQAHPGNCHLKTHPGMCERGSGERNKFNVSGESSRRYHSHKAWAHNAIWNVNCHIPLPVRAVQVLLLLLLLLLLITDIYT